MEKEFALIIQIKSIFNENYHSKYLFLPGFEHLILLRNIHFK